MRLLLEVVLGLALSQAASGQQAMRDPNSLAGRWVFSDGKGGELGMNIALTTIVASDATSLTGTPQELQEFTVGLYQGPNLESPLASFFEVSSNQAATWDGHRLQIDWEKTEAKAHIDLLWKADSHTWLGRFDYGKFHGSQVSLKRPSSPHPSPLVGTWLSEKHPMNNCLHLAQDAKGSFTAWVDDLQIPGRVKYSKHVQRPTQMQEHYGEPTKVTLVAPDEVTVELRAYTAVCCSHLLTVKPAKDGKTLLGNWPPDPNRRRWPARWIRVQGASCIAAQPLNARP